MGTQSLDLLFRGNVRSLAEYDVDTRLCVVSRQYQRGRSLPVKNYKTAYFEWLQ